MTSQQTNMAKVSQNHQLGTFDASPPAEYLFFAQKISLLRGLSWVFHWGAHPGDFMRPKANQQKHSTPLKSQVLSGIKY